MNANTLIRDDLHVDEEEDKEYGRSLGKGKEEQEDEYLYACDDDVQRLCFFPFYIVVVLLQIYL